MKVPGRVIDRFLHEHEIYLLDSDANLQPAKLNLVVAETKRLLNVTSEMHSNYITAMCKRFIIARTFHWIADNKFLNEDQSQSAAFSKKLQSRRDNWEIGHRLAVAENENSENEDSWDADRWSEANNSSDERVGGTSLRRRASEHLEVVSAKKQKTGDRFVSRKYDNLSEDIGSIFDEESDHQESDYDESHLDDQETPSRFIDSPPSTPKSRSVSGTASRDHPAQQTPQHVTSGIAQNEVDDRLRKSISTYLKRGDTNPLIL